MIPLKDNPKKGRYAISVKGRIIPKDESKTYGLDKNNIDKLYDTASFLNMTPAVAFVLVDEQNDCTKIRILIGELNTFEELADNCSFVKTFKFNDEYPNGFEIKLNVNQDHIDAIKNEKRIDYTELSFSGKILSDDKKELFS